MSVEPQRLPVARPVSGAVLEAEKLLSGKSDERGVEE